MIRALAVALLALLGSCGSPSTQVFDLSPSARPAAMTPPHGGPLVYVDRPAVAGYSIVRRW